MQLTSKARSVSLSFIALAGLGVGMGLSFADTGTGRSVREPALKAVTNNPHLGLFALDEPVTATFSLQNPPDGPLKLSVRVVDEKDQTLDERSVDFSLEGDPRTVKVDLPSKKKGFYRVFAKASDGTTIAKTGSRPEGFLTYAVVVDPATRPLFKPSEARFGMQGGFNGALNPLPYLGVRWVNAGPNWRQEEPERAGQFAEKRAKEKAKGGTDAVRVPGATAGYEWCYTMKDGQKVGWAIYPLMSLHTTPDWVSDKRFPLTGHTRVMTPEGETAWRAFCREAAQFARETYPELEERIYQITWEPNWFHGTAEQFLKIYQIAHEEIRGLDKAALIAGPTKAHVGRWGLEQEEEWFKLGLGNLLDLYAIHPYVGLPPEKSGYIEALRFLRQFILKNAGREIPIIGTEQGYPTQERADHELPIARGLIRAHLISLGEGMRLNFGFYIHDYGVPGEVGTEHGYGYFYNLRPGGKFGTDRIAPKPIVPAFAALTYLIDGSLPVKSVDWLGATVQGYVFERGGKLTLSVWDIGDEAGTVTIETGPSAPEVFDWMGNPLPLQAGNGTLTLKLGPEPAYITGLPQNLWGAQATRTLELKDSKLTAFAGETVKLHGLVRASAEAGLKGTLRVDAGPLGRREETVELAAGASGESDLSFAIPAGTAPGTYPMTVSLTSDTGKTWSATGQAHVQLPVELQAVLPVYQPGTEAGALALSQVKVIMAENLNRAWDARLVLNVQPSEPGNEFTLSPNTETTVTQTLIQPVLLEGNPYIIQAKLELRDAPGVERNFPFGFVEARKVSTGPSIDGNVQEWADNPGVALRHPNGSPSEATLSVAWDDKMLYLLCRIPIQGTAPAEAYTLRLLTNKDPQKVRRITGNVFADNNSNPQVNGLSFRFSQSGKEVTRDLSSNPDTLHTGPVGSGVQIARGVEEGFAIFEIAMTWREAGLYSPERKAGNVVGMAFSVHAGDQAAGGLHFLRETPYDLEASGGGFLLFGR